MRPSFGARRGWEWQDRDGSRRSWPGNPWMGIVWLCFILVPLVTAASSNGPVLRYVLVLAAAVVFVAAYVALVLIVFAPGMAGPRWALVGLMGVIAGVLTVTDQSQWAYLFTYCSACLGIVTSASQGMPAVLACTGVAVGCAALGGASAGDEVGVASTTIGVGLLMVLMHDLRVRNEELRCARAELARVAVIEERERFARDLHDLLGHSLSVIAIKAELAGRLLAGSRREQAAAEVADVEQVARQALSEVRQAVSGYRRPTLDGELEGARMALSAAGIHAEVQRSEGALDPEVEAVLAWAVREGATNVIRHSGARSCRLTVSADGPRAAVEVVDDGSGGGAGSGNGIAGLAERAERLRGRLEAGRAPEGQGFRLVVSVPTGGGAA